MGSGPKPGNGPLYRVLGRIGRISESSETPARVRYLHISLGPYARLYSEEYYLDALRALGMTRHGVRRMFRALGIPSLMVGNYRLYDAFTVAVCFRAILRPMGQDVRITMRGLQTRVPKPTRRIWREIMREVIYARALYDRTCTLSLKRETRRAVERILAFALNPDPEAETRRLVAAAAATPDTPGSDPFEHAADPGGTQGRGGIDGLLRPRRRRTGHQTDRIRPGGTV